MHSVCIECKNFVVLGEVIISNTDIVVPYSSIVKYGVLLVIPLTLGMLINRNIIIISNVVMLLLEEDFLHLLSRIYVLPTSIIKK